MELYLIRDLLDKSIERKKLYCFREYGDSTFYCGYVLSYSSNTIQIRHINRYGEDDGILNLSFNAIERITIQGEYIESLEHILENPIPFDSNGISYPSLSASQGFVSILKEYENDRNNILSIETKAEWYTGFVEKIEEHYILFTEIDNAGFVVGTYVIKTEDIETMKINDKYGLKAYLLYNWRRNK